MPADGLSANPMLASILIPTFNGALKIGYCLDALIPQIAGRDVEILVVNDGSTDATSKVVGTYSNVRLITQANAGPAAARNRGAREARGRILLFTDDDCVPMPNWLDAMLAPFNDPEVVGAKGIYRTHQKSLAARFVQIEYEDKYRLMANLPTIDFIDTYSAGFIRDRFQEMNGYDTSFPVACAEDIELSYRMSARGWKMKFVPEAIVYHTHPATFSSYLKKKYKFAFWRVLAVRKNPGKGVKDSHTPQVMKLQLLFLPALVLSVILDLTLRWKISLSALVVGAFLLTAAPFALRAVRKDPVVGVLSPILLAARSCAQMFGVAAGMIYAARNSSRREAVGIR
jgi:GT2 family glycosyltransferase